MSRIERPSAVKSRAPSPPTMVGAFHSLCTHQLWSTVSRSGRGRGALVECCASRVIVLLSNSNSHSEFSALDAARASPVNDSRVCRKPRLRPVPRPGTGGDPGIRCRACGHDALGGGGARRALAGGGAAAAADARPPRLRTPTGAAVFAHPKGARARLQLSLLAHRRHVGTAGHGAGGTYHR